MTSTGPKSLQSLLDGVLPKKGGGDVGAKAPASHSELPPLTLRDAKLVEARKIAQRNEDEGQHAADKGPKLSSQEVDHIEPSLESEMEAAALAERALAIERNQAIDDQLEGLAEELIDPASKNAVMKAVISEQIKDGDSWDPLHVRDDWIHLPHDFVESGEMRSLKDRALRVLLFIKVRASKTTGIAVVNKSEAAEILGLDEKTVQRALDDLRKSNYVKLVEGGPPVKGHGRRYQVIERLRMVNALPVVPNKETELHAEFPYKGGGFKSVSDAARAFAKSGDLNKVVDHELELLPKKSPYLHRALTALHSGVAVDPSFAKPESADQQMVVNHITVNVGGDVNAPITIGTGGISQHVTKMEKAPEINMPDGRGNPLLGALKVVKKRDGEDDIYEAEG